MNETSKSPRSALKRPILVVTGTAREAMLAAASGVTAVQTGSDPRRLRAALELAARGGCRAVVSFGIAGGLDPLLEAGDVVVAESIVCSTIRRPAQPVLAQRVVSVLASGGMKVTLADLAGVDAPLFEPGAKRRLWAETRAAAVDMESHIAAAHAAKHRLPFAAIRVVCDPAWRRLPPWAAAALLPDGEIDVRTALRAMLRRPDRLPATVRLAIDAAAAFRSLGRCRDLLAVGLGAPNLRQPLSNMA